MALFQHQTLIRSNMKLFEKEYTDESFHDLSEDVYWWFGTLKDTNIPVDENGFLTGKFKVTIEWSEDVQ